jgi:hypothetical protein
MSVVITLVLLTQLETMLMTRFLTAEIKMLRHHVQTTV